MAVPAAAMVFAPQALVGVFLDPAAPGAAAAIAHAVVFLKLGALLMMADMAQVAAQGALRGVQDTRAPMLIALAGYWGLGMPLGALLAFPAGLGGTGLWIGFVAGTSAVAAAVVWRWENRIAAARR
jgi:MATE family multidrug resistance protein